MDTFLISLSNVLLTLLYIVPGFILCKMHKAVADHLPTVSAFLIYACGPCMVISAFMAMEYSQENLIQMGWAFLVTAVLQLLFWGILYLILHRKYEDAKYRILSMGAVMGNVGYFGIPIVKAIIPDQPEVMCYAAIYVVTMNVLTFTLGMFMITMDKKYVSWKAAIFNPTILGFVIGFPLFIFGAKEWMPGMLTNAIKLMGDMTTPVCMLILGVRLATMSFRSLFSRGIVYVTCALKLIVYPLFCFAILYFLPFSQVFKASVFILSATPCASMILNLSEMYHSDSKLAANVLLVSTLLCFLTIPALSLLLLI